jgi:hypothetical protein
LSQSKKPSKNQTIKAYELAVIILAIILITYEFAVDAHPFNILNKPSIIAFIVWGIIAGSQMLVTKRLRVPIAPGKWYDFTYVPMWVLIFTLPSFLSFSVLIVYTIAIYLLFGQQFYCRKSVPAYLFHLSYQIVLFFMVTHGFWTVEDHLSLFIGSLSITSTLAMFSSMFALMFTDTLLGGFIQKFEGQHNVWHEWRKDYLRITWIQTLLSSIAMLFAVLYHSEHYIQLAVAYVFFLLGVCVMYRTSFRSNDYMGLLRSMINMVEIKDTYTKNHSESVGYYSVVLGQMAGLSASQLERLKIAAQLHDIGKVGIPDSILKKEGPLTDEEYAIMKTHTQLGEKVLEPIHSLHREAFIVGRHHEHYNGRGYPYGVSGSDIPLESKTISISDGFPLIQASPYNKSCIGTTSQVH